MSATVDLRRFVYLLGYAYPHHEIVEALEKVLATEKESTW